MPFANQLHAEEAAQVKAEISLFEAALSFNVDSVRSLLQRKADINRLDENGNNALMAMVASGKACDDADCAEKRAITEIAQLMVDHNVDLALKNNDGKNALEIARENEHVGAAECIEKAMGQ